MSDRTMMRRPLFAAVICAVLACAILTAVTLSPRPAQASVPLPPMAPRTLWPNTTAGSWVYAQYQHDFAVGAYECAAGHRLSYFLGSAYETKACVDWYLIIKAHSFRARQWHAMDYYKYFYINFKEWQYFNSIVNLYTGYAKHLTNLTRATYWAVATTTCYAAGKTVQTRTGRGDLAALAAGACFKAFNNYNPFGGL